MLGFDSYQELFYFETSLNPSDDPTRGRSLRQPTAPPPEWWDLLASGDFACFDAWLASHGLDDHSMSGLPDFADLGFDARSEPPIVSSCVAPVPEGPVDVESDVHMSNSDLSCERAAVELPQRPLSRQHPAAWSPSRVVVPMSA